MTAGSRDRWHELADAIQDANLPASDKAVFLHLLSRADYRTADLPARFTPTRKAIARKTSLSYRQVGYSTQHLKRHGWLTAGGATSPGHPLGYGFAVGAQCDCPGRVHVRQRWQPDTATVATTATERWQPTVATPQVTPQTTLVGNEREEVKRGHLFDEDWWPADTIGAEVNGETYPPATHLSRKDQPLATLTHMSTTMPDCPRCGRPAEAHATPATRTMKARWDNTVCPRCHMTIRRGHRIAQVGDGWCHIECVNGRKPPMIGWPTAA